MINKVTLVGRVGKDPEQHQLETGIVVNFSLATSERWKDKSGEKQESTEWHNCKAFGSLAEIITKYVKKGDLLYIEGKIKTRSWEKDGTKHYATDIVCNTVKMLSGKSERPQDESVPSENYTQNKDIGPSNLPW